MSEQEADIEFILGAWASQGLVLNDYKRALTAYFREHPTERMRWRQRITQNEAEASGLNDLAGELLKAR